ncbi:zinc ribbon domain-containing protein [Methanolobus sp. ZRKC2]|uniref:zinc ribbon domain-containing protein n=1 Tax=Methanolobus sp. ZRKC2 TaxID=3125783 RepID=UPI00324FE126
MMRLRRSYFDPRDNLRIGILIGAFFGLAGGFKGLLGGVVIGVFMALLTAYVVQNVKYQNIYNNSHNKRDPLSYALFLGFLLSIFGTIVFSSFEPAGLIIFFVCMSVALRSGLKVKKDMKEKEEKEGLRRDKQLEYEKRVSECLEVRLSIQQPLKTGLENPVKITINNPSSESIENIRIKYVFSRMVKCDEPELHIDVVPPGSSKYTALFIYPRMSDTIELGKLEVSYLINRNFYRKAPIDIGPYESVQSSVEHVAGNTSSTGLQVLRETEFYQGFIRLKMSISNISSLVVTDVALEFDFDEDVLRIDRFEPAYTTRNGKLILGSIEGNSSKSVAVYFDPLICSRSTEIKCQVSFKDAKGQLQNTLMQAKKIAVTCPIMKTDSDINIGMLKEFLDKLPFKDSKVYKIEFLPDVGELVTTCRETVQKHDVRHVRSFRTTDDRVHESWYYGKTKVKGHVVILKVTISEDTGSIELFGATETAESLVGMLAELGRETQQDIAALNIGSGGVSQIVNVVIKDSIIQRSNLLNSCDMSGSCNGEVVIDDSIILGTDMNANYCPSCGSKLFSDANFCTDCGAKVRLLD